MKPKVSVKIDDQELSKAVKDRIISLSVTDEVGFVSDQLVIVFEDAKGDLAIPRAGVGIEVAVGYDVVTSLGRYVVDEVSLQEGEMTVSANGFDTRSGIKTIKTRKIPTLVLGEIVDLLANDNDLNANISPSLASLLLSKEIFQRNESDLSLLKRLADNYNATVKIQGGNLVFVVRGEGKSVSGRDLEAFEIVKSDVESWNAILTGRSEYKSVEASFVDVDTGETKKVVVGSGSPKFVMPIPFNDEIQATNGAEAVLDGQGYKTRTASLSMTGNPKIKAESLVELKGFRNGIDGRWIVKKAVDSISDGYMKQIECVKSLERS